MWMRKSVLVFSSNRNINSTTDFASRGVVCNSAALLLYMILERWCGLGDMRLYSSVMYLIIISVTAVNCQTVSTNQLTVDARAALSRNFIPRSITIVHWTNTIRLTSECASKMDATRFLLGTSMSAVSSPWDERRNHAAYPTQSGPSVGGTRTISLLPPSCKSNLPSRNHYRMEDGACVPHTRFYGLHCL